MKKTTKGLKKADWVWQPHAGHFIMGNNCLFRMNTYVGGYIVSTVGELMHDSEVREIMAKSRGIDLVGKGDARHADYMEKIGYDSVGHNRKYESMVFKAKSSGSRCSCCEWIIEQAEDVDSGSYNDSVSARKGHMKLCLKWSGEEDVS